MAKIMSHLYFSALKFHNIYLILFFKSFFQDILSIIIQFFKGNKMVRLNIILKYIFIISSISLLVILPFIIFNGAYFNWSFNIDTDLASRFGDFFGGFIGTLFSILSVLLLIYTITSQYIETSKNKAKDHFFKMLDYHTENVRSTKVGSIEAAKADIVEEGR